VDVFHSGIGQCDLRELELEHFASGTRTCMEGAEPSGAPSPCQSA
jgi:hypothetical protein